MPRFPLPTMPFNREISIGVGTQIRLTAKPYPDSKRIVNFKLLNSNEEIGLNIQLDLGQTQKLSINCNIGGQISSSLDYNLQIPFERSFLLLINTFQHSFQICLNGIKIADFIHRIDPASLRKISITGPLICEEVDITDGPREPLPTYEQATTNLMKNMSLNDAAPLPSKIPSAPISDDLPAPPPNILNPTMESSSSSASSAFPTTTTSSSFFYTGNSQGFSNHPYPLPGLIDNSTQSSQPFPTNPLPQPNPIPPTNVTPIIPTVPISSPPYPIENSRSTTTVPPAVPYPPDNSRTPQPYTVTFPQTPASTPTVIPQYQNTQQIQPIQLQQQQQPPQFQYPSHIYPPTAQQMMQPYPVGVGVQQIPPVTVAVPPAVPQPYYYPPQAYVQGYNPYGGVYYTPEYYPHHHHRHHHHHCD